jgi:peptidoglycan/LPS O-acetylase OafA/YrhL
MDKTQTIQLFHIIIIASLFIYIGTARTNIPDFMFPIIMGLGVIVISYHAYKVFANPNRAWLYLIHALIIGPLLVYIGYTGKNTERRYFEMLLLLAFATLGYNGFYFVQGMMQ